MNTYGPEANESALSIDCLSARYDSKPILTGVSLTVADGESVLVIGPNGCGKSTLLKACLGLVPFVSGKILLRGRDVVRLSTIEIVRMGIGYAPQHQGLFYGMTVEENLLDRK